MQTVSLVDAVRGLVNREGISEDLIYETVEQALLAAYKKKYGTQSNAVTRIDEDKGDVFLYSKKEVVDNDDYDDEIVEISIDEAKKMNPECEIGDEVLVEIKLNDFSRIEIQTAKQIVLQRLNEIKKDVLYSEYKNKVGQIVSGEFQRERYGTIFVNLGKTEAILPKGEQSPRERYIQGDRIRAIIHEVKKNNRDTSIILSRASTEFIRALFELEVPEISKDTVEIVGVVRDKGSRTKIAVSSMLIDPVGACVGLKGIRIQSIVKELEGEKIDIIKFEQEVRHYIKNALLPAKVEKVNITNKEEQNAVAIVNNDQLSLAIGKQGQNVRLARDLTGWNIEVITNEEYENEPDQYKDISQLDWQDAFTEEEETHDISMLEDLSIIIIDKLREVGITTIEALIETPKEELEQIPGIGPKTTELIENVLKDMVEVVDEESEEVTDIEEETTEEPIKEITHQEVVHEYQYEYQCPQCEFPINEMIIICPKCGIELEFE